MDELAQFNKARWRHCGRSREILAPMLNLTPSRRARLVDERGLLGDLSGKRVLCLAGGGGQQSAAFALLGAQVTVIDLSDTQLERDARRGALWLSATLISGDMRDLSALGSQSFDVVWTACHQLCARRRGRL